eukprot:m.433406 g.433406  ORF g.433406 m.433406 type:complete len:499 (-) comp17571_c0_seq1:68-1564(-)
MHISIPESEELIDETSTKNPPPKYVSYRIHINGTYHCSARFSQLHKLNERLTKQYGKGCMEVFPGKSLLYMKPEQAHFRRYQLQNWLQKIGAQPLIVQGEIFQNFLLNAQKEVQKGPEEDAQLEIFLVNGKSVTVDILSTDQTDDVLEAVIQLIGMEPDLTYYFALYLVEDSTGKVTIRRLQDFESPFISLRRASAENKVMLRTAFWNQVVAGPLHADPIALNLIYIETIADIKKGWIVVDDDVADDLAQYRAQKDRESFLRVAKNLKGFGCECFGEATCSFPAEGSKCTVRLGNDDLSLEDESGKEWKFKVQRMRCWRTYTVEEGVEMEFEYYFDPVRGAQEGEMKWVKILSTQTIHIAMCLQFLVEEMLRLRKKQGIKKPSDRVGQFKPRRAVQNKVDLEFLTTSETVDGASPPPKTSIGAALGFGKGPRVSVSLSDLMAKVKAEKEESLHTDVVGMHSVDEDGGEAKEGDTHDDPDDYDSDEDDDKRAFASMAGL